MIAHSKELIMLNRMITKLKWFIDFGQSCDQLKFGVFLYLEVCISAQNWDLKLILVFFDLARRALSNELSFVFLKIFPKISLVPPMDFWNSGAYILKMNKDIQNSSSDL